MWDPPRSHDGPEDSRSRRRTHCHYEDRLQNCSFENKGLPSLYVQHIMHLLTCLNLNVAVHHSLVRSMDRAWKTKTRCVGWRECHSAFKSWVLYAYSAWCLAYFSSLYMEAEHFSETLVNFYQPAQLDIPQKIIHHSHWCENLKSILNHVRKVMLVICMKSAKHDSSLTMREIYK
jgi:hypothetical protein